MLGYGMGIKANMRVAIQYCIKEEILKKKLEFALRT